MKKVITLLLAAMMLLSACTFGQTSHVRIDNPNSSSSTEQSESSSRPSGKEDAKNESDAKKVIQLIDAIGTVTLNSETAINRARTAYDALSEAAKALVTNYQTLVNAEMSLENLKSEADSSALREKADYVIGLISALFPLSFSSDGQVAEARAAYDALPEDAKALVTNYQTLLDAEAEVPYVMEALYVVSMIESIGTVTLDSESMITAARSMYEALSAKAKEYVSNYQTLLDAEAVLEDLKQQMLTGNTVDVEAVTGATLSSTAFIAAVKDALSQAGIDPESLVATGETAEAAELEDAYDCDVLVIGAGGAGMAAAIKAKEAGANVILIEKMNNIGGNTLLSGGEIAAPGNWLQQEGVDSVEQMEADLAKAGGNPELDHVLASNALNAAEWLRDDVNVEFEDYMLFFGGHSVERSLVPKGATAVELVNKLWAKVQDLGVTVFTNTRATELMVEDGKVVGAKAENNGKTVEFRAKNVVLTTGGFGSNVEMRKANDPAMDEKILSTNTVGSTGDGITMATAIGADTVDMQYIQTYPTCDAETGALLYVADVRLDSYGVLVNKEGKRFVEELEARNVISKAVTEQTGACSYLFWDEDAMQKSGVAETHKAEYEDLLARGQLVKADTLEACCEHFGVDAENLKQTVADWNQYCADGEDKEFNKRGDLIPIAEEGPYYMLVSKPAIHHTMGGIVIDTDAHVLDTDGNVIPGLYAAGEVTGGIHGNNRLGSCAIADIIVFGRIAGENAAK